MFWAGALVGLIVGSAIVSLLHMDGNVVPPRVVEAERQRDQYKALLDTIAEEAAKRHGPWNGRSVNGFKPPPIAH